MTERLVFRLNAGVAGVTGVTRVRSQRACQADSCETHECWSHVKPGRMSETGRPMVEVAAEETSLCAGELTGLEIRKFSAQRLKRAKRN